MTICAVFLGASGNFRRARLFASEGLRLNRRFNNPLGIATSQATLARVDVAEGNLERADNGFKTALHLSQKQGHQERMIYCIEGLAHVAMETEQLEKASQLWAATERWRQIVGTPLPPFDREPNQRALAHLKQLLGTETFDHHTTVGQLLTWEETVALAIGN